MTSSLQKFRNGLEKLGIAYSEKMIEQFLIFYEMLMEKNKVMNLTTITELDEVVEKHFLDSLSLIKSVNLKENLKILDLGTGAGFPGIPLKIAFPQLEIVLLDSLNKRILFLQEVIEKLQLLKISAIHGRAEELGRNIEFREKFELCVSRAVANLSSLSEYCIPFVKPGGRFIAYKSGEVEEEVQRAKKAIVILGGNIEEIKKFTLDGTEFSRSLIEIRKESKTPKEYPRKAGIPSKTPI